MAILLPTPLDVIKRCGGVVVLVWGGGVVKGDRSNLEWSHVLKYHHEQVFIDLWFQTWKKFFFFCDFFGEYEGDFYPPFSIPRRSRMEWVVPTLLILQLAHRVSVL